MVSFDMMLKVPLMTIRDSLNTTVFPLGKNCVFVLVFNQIQVSFGTHVSHLRWFILIHWQATSSQLLLSSFMARYSCISINSNLVWVDLRCLPSIPKPKLKSFPLSHGWKTTQRLKDVESTSQQLQILQKGEHADSLFAQAPVHQFSDVRSRSSRTFVACCPLTGIVNRKNDGLWIEGNLGSIGPIPI